MNGDRRANRVLMAAMLAGGMFAAAPAVAEAPDIAHGRALVETNCSACHAVGTEGASPFEEAPELRTLSRRYPIDALEEAFAEGIITGHPGMPEFQATPGQIADIIAYMESIQEQ